MRHFVSATLVGIAIGVTYVLSPLTVWFVVAMWALRRYAVAGVDADEARWLTALLVIAVALRVAAIAWLFVHTNHAQTPFSVFFGDEEFYIRRSIWLRNVALRVPIHSADLIYAFDESGWTSHLYVLAFAQALVGPSPYGVHLIGVGFYLAASFMLFRMTRRPFGRVPALLALAVMLFLPSFFAWSITALKEPLYLLMTVTAITLAMTIARRPGWIVTIAALASLAIVLAALDSIRPGAALLAGGGILCGFALAWLLQRPRALVAVAVAVPIVVGAALRSPSRQIQAYVAINHAARQHWGHVATPGWVYTLLDERFYADASTLSDLGFVDEARYVVRAVERYITVPLPWEAQSLAALAYLPEQLVWYFIVALLPVGVVYSWRRDVLLASLLLSIGAVAALAIALLSGNVGTLVRLRVLSMPYLAVLSMVGLTELLARPVRRRESDRLEKAEFICP